jgi:hypothetical protein
VLRAAVVTHKPVQQAAGKDLGEVGAGKGLLEMLGKKASTQK